VPHPSHALSCRSANGLISDWFWLRDNDPSKRTANGQKLHETTLLTDDQVTAVGAEVAVDGRVKVTWADKTETSYGASWLRHYACRCPPMSIVSLRARCRHACAAVLFACLAHVARNTCLLSLRVGPHGQRLHPLTPSRLPTTHASCALPDDKRTASLSQDTPKRDQRRLWGRAQGFRGGGGSKSSSSSSSSSGDDRVGNDGDVSCVPDWLTWHDHARVVANADARRLWLRDVVVSGFAMLDNVPVCDGAILDVARLFGYVRETNYGTLFE
jgi:hypothetical protein